MRYRIIVEFDAPDQHNGNVTEFVERALRAEVGHCHPNDPMHFLERETIKVTSTTKDRVK